MTISLRPRLLALAWPCLAAAPALAQVADGGLPEIVVTAERRPDVAARLPVAVSVLSGAELAARGVTSVNQLQYQTPGLEAVPAFGGGQPNFRLRGLGFDDYASNNASPVGVTVDEVARPLPVETQVLLFDLDRVEVLRGPQGTLYGRNTTAGAINFVTTKPTDRLSAGVDADYGSFGLFRGEAHLSGPLGAGFSARLAAGAEQGGGFQRDRATSRPLGGADRVGARGELAYQGGRLDTLLTAAWNRDRSDATGLYLFEPLAHPFGGAAVGIPADTDHRATGWGASPAFARLLGVAADAKPFRDNRQVSLTGRLAYDLGGATLTSLTGWNGFRRREYNDWDASAYAYAGTFFDTRAHDLSQEVRLQSTGDGALRWIAGAYYADGTLRDRFLSDFVESLGFVALTAYRQRTATVAGFGQLDWRFAPDLTLTAGARVEHERLRLDDFTTTTRPVIGIGVADAASRLAYTQPTGKLAVSWQAGADGLFYLSASRGVKSGGFTAYNTLTVGQLAPFRPEVLYAYEVGTKQAFAGRRLRLDLAGFYYDYRRQQVQSAIYDPVYGAVGRLVNAPRSHIYGVEANLRWRPAPRLELTQGLAWRVGRFDRFDDLDIAASAAAGRAVTVGRRGQDQGFPHWSYTGAASYTLPLGGAALVAATDYAYRGPNEPVLLGPLFRVRDYVLWNANLSIGPTGGRWRLGLYVRNLLDQRYDLTRNFFLGGIDIASPGRPRSAGVTARYGF